MSTGSGIALAYLPLARLMGIDCHYIESAARSSGPSLTGRLLEHVPGIRRSTQYSGWADGRWSNDVSIFDAFEAARPVATPPVGRVVVTLGTMTDFGFRRLVERLLLIVPPDVDVLWQTGSTPVQDLPIRPTPWLAHGNLLEAMSACDAVVAHAGVGSALAAMQCGRKPVLIPRSKDYGEHIDDHQIQIARELAGRGLAVESSVEQLTWADVRGAATYVVRRR